MGYIPWSDVLSGGPNPFRDIQKTSWPGLFHFIKLLKKLSRKGFGQKTYVPERALCGPCFFEQRPLDRCLFVCSIITEAQKTAEIWEILRFLRADKHGDIWVCLKMLCTPTPNGFADHYPVFTWLFHWEYTLFSDKPIFTYLCLSLYGSELVEIGICFHSLHAESRGG